jgi:hypothetical protein
MNNTITQNTLLDMAHIWLKEGKNFDQIRESLESMELSTEAVDELMKHIRDERYEAHRKIGLPLVAAGVVMCVSGCMATLYLGELGAAFHFCLYGLTSIGAITIISGLAYILG